MFYQTTLVLLEFYRYCLLETSVIFYFIIQIVPDAYRMKGTETLKTTLMKVSAGKSVR